MRWNVEGAWRWVWLALSVVALWGCTSSEGAPDGQAQREQAPDAAVVREGRTARRQQTAPRSLQVLSQTPKGVVTTSQAINVVFNQPVVALTGLDAQRARAMIEVTPPLAGTVRWIGTSTLSFVPEAPLAPATRYEVTIPAGLSAVSGQRLEAAERWSFETARPRLTQRLPSDRSRWVETDEEIWLAFDQPVVLETVVEQTRLEVNGAAVAFEARRADRSREEEAARLEGLSDAAQALVLVPGEALPQGATIKVTVGAGVQSTLGPLRSSEAATWTFSTYGEMRVEEARCGSPCRPSDDVVVAFSNPLPEATREALREGGEGAREVVRGMVTIAPEVALESAWVSWQGERLYLNYDLAPKQRYTVRVAAGVADRFGNMTAAVHQGAVDVGHHWPTLSMAGGQGVLEPGTIEALPATARNMDAVTVRAAELSEDALVPATRLSYQADDWERFWSAHGQSGQTQRHDFRATRDAWRSFEVPLTGALGADGRGAVIYEVVATSALSARPEGVEARHQGLLQISDVGLTAKASRDETLIWVTSLVTGEPLAGVAVRVRDHDNRLLWEGTSDAEGLALAPGSAALGGDGQRYVTAAHGGALSLLGLRGDYELSPWRFGLSSSAWSYQEVVAHLFTDRGIYRTGDTVHVKGVVRQEKRSQWAQPDQREVRVTVYDAEGEVVEDEARVALSAAGTFTLDLALPRDAALGHYRVKVATSDGQVAGSQGFRVEAYRAPDFKVRAGLTAADGGGQAIAGAPLRLEGSGEYLFGAPMGGALARWTLLKHSADWSPPGEWAGYSFINRDRERVGGVVTSGEGALDALGRLTEDWPLAAGSIDGPTRFTLDLEVQDLTNQTVASSASALVHPGDRYLGVGIEGWVVTSGAPVTVNYVAVTPQGAPVAGVAGELTLYRRTWRTVREKGPGGVWRYRSEREDEALGSCALRSASAPVSCALEVPKAGSYVVRARGVDSRGQAIESTRAFYASGSERVGWEQRDEHMMELIADRDAYEPGDVAKVLVQNPLGDATALVTLERNGVLETRVTRLGSADTIEVPISEAHVPNLYLSVVVVSGRSAPYDAASDEDAGRPGMRAGYIELPVSVASRRLAVEVATSEAQVEPGQEVELEVSVRDASGAGASAELALYVVDEAVLGLTGYETPDLLARFYAPRPLGVLTADSRLHLLEVDEGGVKGYQPSGGGGGSGAHRSRFATTVHWSGQLETDVTGRVTVRVQMPENLSAFRVMAVAVDADARFGHGEGVVRVSKPLLARPALPRFVRLDDHFQAGLVVNNLTGQAGTAEVRLELVAGGLVASGALVHTVELAAGEAREVRFGLRAAEAAAATLRFSVQMGEARDGVEARLPVLAPAPVEVVATSGVVEEPVLERLALPQGARDDVGGLDVSLASTALVELEGSVRYVLDYPYGCLEQTASQLLLLLTLQPVLETFELADLDPAIVAARVEAGLTRLLELERPYDGGFRMWPSSGDRRADASVYALDVLQQAATQGHEVAARALERGRSFLFEVARGAHDQETHSAGAALAMRAHAVLVLARMGELEHGVMASLYERRAELPIGAQTHLARALHLSGEAGREQVEVLEQAIENAVAISHGGAYLGEPQPEALGVMWRSDVRTTALGLQALLEIDPAHPLIPKLVFWLQDRRRAGGWINTQDNAQATRSMFDYIQVFEREAPDMTASVFLGQDLLYKQPFVGRSRDVATRRVPMARLRDADLTLAREGQGRLHYTLRLAYAPSDRTLPPREEGMTITRAYETLEGAPLEGVVAPGAVVKVRLTVVAPRDRFDVAVHDTLPAGLEPVDLRLRTTSAALAHAFDESERDARGARSWYARFAFDHVEKHDDRVQLFADYLPAGVYEYVYLARATTRGTFAAPPARAEEMYNPEVFGLSAGALLEVR